MQEVLNTTKNVIYIGQEAVSNNRISCVYVRISCTHFCDTFAQLTPQKCSSPDAASKECVSDTVGRMGTPCGGAHHKVGIGEGIERVSGSEAGVVRNNVEDDSKRRKRSE